MTSTQAKTSVIKRLARTYESFLFESCSPRTCVLVRIAYSALVLIYTLVWMQDAERWFSDEGVMSSETARAILDGEQLSIFYWVPASLPLVWFGLGSLLVHATLMLFGVFSRVQAACIFFWLVNFQHRNPLILDGEDTVFRLLAFFLIFLPLDSAFSLRDASLRSSFWDYRAAWGLRLIQAEMALIYFSAAWSKALGASWRDGSALFYVFQMQDLFGRGPLPDWITQSEFIIRSSTWAVVLVEAMLPILLFWPRTRRWGIVLGIALHLTIEYSMHLFLFQWIMIVGLLSFIAPEDWELLGRLRSRIRGDVGCAAVQVRQHVKQEGRRKVPSES